MFYQFSILWKYFLKNIFTKYPLLFVKSQKCLHLKTQFFAIPRKTTKTIVFALCAIHQKNGKILHQKNTKKLFCAARNTPKKHQKKFFALRAICQKTTKYYCCNWNKWKILGSRFFLSNIKF